MKIIFEKETKVIIMVLMDDDVVDIKMDGFDINGVFMYHNSLCEIVENGILSLINIPDDIKPQYYSFVDGQIVKNIEYIKYMNDTLSKQSKSGKFIRGSK